MADQASIDCSFMRLAELDYSSHIESSKTITGDRTVDADVVIVGSGAGGAACGYELTKIPGLNVVMIEAGPYVPLSQFNQNLLDMMAKLAWGKSNDGSADGSFRTVHGRCVGGSTILHMLTMTPLSPHVLGLWRDKLGLTDFTPEALAPYVSELKEIMNIKQVPRERVNANAQKWIEGCEKLGHYWRLNDRNAGNCIGSGRCHTGCPFGGKVSMDVSLVPRALNQGLKLYTDAFVTNIVATDQEATGVEAIVQTEDFKVVGRLTVRAKVVVVAGGAIQTPGLLLRSGLQSPQQTVGAKLCAQPGINIFGEYDHEVFGWRGITNPIHIDQWAELEEGAFFIEPGMLDASVNADYLPGVGRAHAERMARLKNMTAAQILYADSGKSNRVVFRDGRADVEFNLTEADHKHMRFAIQESARILFASGAKAVYVGQREPLVLQSVGALGDVGRIKFGKADFHFETVHAHGSCPMSLAPKDGVVAPDGECHHRKRLFLADASILPTPICMNTTIPSATLGMHVARRLSAKYFG